MASGDRIVVGVADDPAADGPLRWAFREAALWKSPLDVVHAWQQPYVISSTGIPGPALDLAPYEEQAKRVLDREITALPVDVRLAVSEVNPIAVRGKASGVLVEASRGARLLVVGSRGHGAVRGLLGSVSHQCVHHASSPIAVVPPVWRDEAFGRIVVGVDGSDGSALALRWAIDEAAHRSVHLEVVHSWTTPYPVEPWGTVVTPVDQHAFDDHARESMEAMVERAVRLGAHHPRSISYTPVHDASGPALASASDESDLLVVGSRGRGGFAALLLGSTSLYCLHHATRPVVIVRCPPFLQ
jgi:nucleotide-binding universal stress UspA family protein